MDKNIAEIKRQIEISNAFKPGAPIENYKMFAGRIIPKRKLVNALGQSGRHIVIYGERGIGKTSLVGILGDIIAEANLKPFIIVRISCGRDFTFDQIWRAAFRELITISKDAKYRLVLSNIDKGEKYALNALPTDPMTSEDVRFYLKRFPENIIIIIDEIDLLADKTVMKLMADTIKTLSDHLIKTSLILVGIAENIEDLIGRHQSVERTLIQIRLDRMNSHEMRESLNKCLDLAQMTIDPNGRERIIIVSKGLPHFNHLLGVYSAQIANSHNRSHITVDDVTKGLEEALDNVDHSIRASYVKAVHSNKSINLHKDILLACALAEEDEVGYFRALDVKNALHELTHETFELSLIARVVAEFISEKRGYILERRGKRQGYTYRFTNPLMQPYVLMKGVQTKQIDYDRIKLFEP